MPKILIFDLKGTMAHFRLPDTTVTHASYPFIPRTTLHGLLASVLGLESLDDGKGDNGSGYDNLVGIKLMSPVKSSFQKVSMLGKGWAGSSGDSFNRPVSIEVLVNPYYRIYYVGPYLDSLGDMIASRKSKYHTYLGSCFCPVVPRYVNMPNARELCPLPSPLATGTVVPTFVVERLIPQPGCEYARAGGFHYQHLGNRQFKGTLNMVYDVNGKSLLIEPRADLSEEPDLPVVKFFETEEGETVCMW